MNVTTVLIVALSAAAGCVIGVGQVRTARPTEVPRGLVVFSPTALPAPGVSIPVGRKPELEASRIGADLWICGDARITTPLPVGYADPTAPGAIELKSYPSLRRAEVSGSMLPDMASNLGFWKLFNHIQSRQIAMTSPVEMDYPGLDLDGDMKNGAWSMAFLYRNPTLGDAGQAGDVRVADSTPLTYLSVGAKGSYGMRDTKRVLATLKQALAELDGFEAAGPVRVLHYNGPDVRNGQKWFEVQIPVKLRACRKVTPV